MQSDSYTTFITTSLKSLLRTFMDSSSTDLAVAGIFLLILIVTLLLIGRFAVMWYFKINKIMEMLEAIDEDVYELSQQLKDKKKRANRRNDDDS
jgi:hypothetical protein